MEELELLSKQKKASDAGADWIVTGTLTEDAADLADLQSKISAINDALQSQ